MRIVALEEHFTLPEFVAKIDPSRIAERGFPTQKNAPAQIRIQEQLKDLGSARLSSMDSAGITVHVLSASGPGADLLDPAESIPFARDYNDALARRVAEHPDRLAGFAHLPMPAPEAAADELERAVTRLDFRGALINGMTCDLFLDDPSFEPILARAEQLDVPIYLHPNLPPRSVRKAYYDGLPGNTGFMLSIAGWGWHAETAVHVLRLVLSGALDRHPRLKIIIGHMGEGLPAMLTRCDQEFGPHVSYLQRSISQTITDQVYVTTSGFFTLPPFLAALAMFGIDRLMFSIDYPYGSNKQGRAFLDSLTLAPENIAKLAHGNADRLLKLQPVA
jgi:predicted TIM-barrel fold metal-dependent hydrolase